MKRNVNKLIKYDNYYHLKRKNTVIERSACPDTNDNQNGIQGGEHNHNVQKEIHRQRPADDS